MGFDGLDAYEEGVGDLLVAFAGGDLLDNLVFAAGYSDTGRFVWAPAAILFTGIVIFKYQLGDGVVEKIVTTCDSPNGLNHFFTVRVFGQVAVNAALNALRNVVA